MIPRDDSNTEWPCSWEAHELEELREGVTRPFREKLIWLEEMTEFAGKLQASASLKESSPRSYKTS
jgi:hypothetical protein